MKKFYLVLVVLFAVVYAGAQGEAGKFYITPKVGWGLSTLSGHFNVSKFKTPDYGMKMNAGVVAGVEADYRATKLLGVSAGVFYSSQKSKLENTYLWKSETGHDVFSELSGKIKQSYINIPVLANFYVYKTLALKVGAQFGFKTKSEFNVNEKETCLYIPVMDLSDDCEDNYRIFAAGDFNGNSMVVSVPIGVSYEYAGVVLDVRYNIGVTKSVDEKNPLLDASLKNNVLQITLGYKFKI